MKIIEKLIRLLTLNNINVFILNILDIYLKILLNIVYLTIFHLSTYKLPYIFFYKTFNKIGKVYVKLGIEPKKLEDIKKRET